MCVLFIAAFIGCVIASILIVILSMKSPRIDRNSPYPVFKTVHVRNGFLEIDMRDVDIFWTHRSSIIYLTKKGTYILFTTGAYGDTYEAISKDRAKQYVIQTTGIKNSVKLFPGIEEEMASFKNEI
jgi:hypothetical protein